MACKKNILLLFAPKFHHFGIDICKAYLKYAPTAKVYGLHTGDNNKKLEVESELRENLGQMWLLSKEEKRWLERDVSQEDLESIDRQYGAGALGKIITSDRRVGRGFVSGGLCRPDQIGELAIEKPISVPEGYVVCLIHAIEDILSIANPRVVFCYAVAGAPAMALAMVCWKKGIPFTRLTPARVDQRFVVDTDALGRLEPVLEKYAAIRKSPTENQELIEEARAIQRRFRNDPAPPEYMIRNYKIIRDAKPWFLTLKIILAMVGTIGGAILRRVDKIRLRRMIHENKIQWKQRHMGSEWFCAPPKERKYIYFPLHVDPEASTMVMSPSYTDQLSVIEALAKSAPSDMIVVVKEHLPMLGRRPEGFYRRISQMPRVVLVSPELNGIELVKKASMVAVITGTAIWEAIRLKIPALVIGESPYLCIKGGATHQPCLAKLAESIKEELKNPVADDLDIEYYIAAVLSESFELPAEVLWGEYTDQLDEHKKTIAQEVAWWIEKRSGAYSAQVSA